MHSAGLNLGIYFFVTYLLMIQVMVDKLTEALGKYLSIWRCLKKIPNIIYSKILHK